MKKQNSVFKNSFIIELKNAKSWFILTGLLCVATYFFGSLYYNYKASSLYINDIKSVITLASVLPVTIGMIILLGLYSLNSFKYLYDRQQLDYYNALPVSRQTTFVSKTLVGIVMIVESLIISLVGVNLENFFYKTNYSFKAQLNDFTYVFIAFVVVLMMFVCCSVTASSTFQFCFIAVGFFVVLPIDVTGIANYLCSNIVGFNGIYYLDNLNLVKVLNVFNYNQYISNQWILYLVAILLIVAIYCLSKYVFVTRKSEFAQQQPSSKVVTAIVVGIYSLLGFATFKVYNIENEGKVNFYSAFIIGSIVVCAILIVVCSFILNKKFPQKNYLITFGILVVLMIGVSYSINSDLFNYKNAVPNVSDVKSVTCNIVGNYSFDGEKEKSSYTFNEKENIKSVIAKQKYRIYHNTQYDLTNQDSCLIQLKYTLNDGKKINRTYYCEEYYDNYQYNDIEFCGSGLVATDEGKKQSSFFNDFNINDVEFMTISYIDNSSENDDDNENNRYVYVLDKKDRKNVCNILQQSFENSEVSPNQDYDNYYQVTCYTFNDNTSKTTKDNLKQVKDQKYGQYFDEYLRCVYSEVYEYTFDIKADNGKDLNKIIDKYYTE